MTDVFPHTVKEMTPDIIRLTFQLPLGIDHAHCYFVRGVSGEWIVVDSAVAYPGTEAVWRSVIAELDAPVGRIFITHYHPDHVGGGGLVHEITGAPVFEGELDFNACLAAWAPPANKRRFSGLLEAHGFDMDVAAGAQASDEILAANPGEVEDYRNGDDDRRKKLRGFFMGKCMAALKGQGNPQLLNRLLDERLG